jgi:hypothetical protein
MHRRLLAPISLLVPLIAGVVGWGPHSVAADSPAFADPAFQQAWNRTDQATAAGRKAAPWIWGPAPLAARQEPYVEAPGGQRLVQYFDKGRMEHNGPGVASGRLVVELISGQIQTGAGRTETRLPAEVPLVGDMPGGSATTPTYSTLVRFANVGGHGSRAPRLAAGTPITQTLTRSGFPGALPDGAVPLDGRSHSAAYVAATGHNIPAAFWGFLTGPALRQAAPNGWVALLGNPISEAYWMPAHIGAGDVWVLVQAFERRVLTFNPANPRAFQVEMGNVGRHYLAWRDASAPAACPDPVAPGFAPVLAHAPASAAALGCPIDEPIPVFTSIQKFEHGAMVELHPDSLTGWGDYVLFDDGSFLRYDDINADKHPYERPLHPPPGRYVPHDIWGTIWLLNLRGQIRTRLGWGIEPEHPAPGIRQRFDHGALFWVPGDGQILAIYDQAPWAGRITRWQLFDTRYAPP